MENSAGSAEREVGIASDSIEYKLNALKETWVGMLQSLADRGAINGVIEFLTTASNLLGGIVKTVGVLPTLGGLISGGLSMTKDIGIWQAMKGSNKNDIAKELIASGKDVTIGAGGRVLVTPEQMKYMQQYNVALQTQNKEAEIAKVIDAEMEKSLEGVAAKAEDGSYKWQEYTVKTKAAAAGTKLLSAAMNMVITSLAVTVVQGIFSFFDGLINSTDKLYESASKLGEELKTQQDDLSSYSTKIEELKNTINSSYSSITEVTEARKSLMSIQDEIIQKYGKEAGAIANVSESIEDQKQKIEDLNRANYLSKVSEFNEWKTDGWYDIVGALGNIGGWLGRTIGGYSNKMEEFVDDYANMTVKIGNLSSSVNSDIKDNPLIKQIFENNGFTWNGVEGMQYTGQAEEVYSNLLEIQKEIQDTGIEVPNLMESITDSISETNKKIQEGSELYKNYILYDKIFTNKDYTSYYNKVTEAAEKLQEAMASGDNDKIAKAAEEYQKILSEALSKISPEDSEVYKYLNDLYPQLKAIVNEWTFEYTLKPKLETPEKKKTYSTYKTTEDWKAALKNPSGGYHNGQETNKSDAIAEMKKDAKDAGYDNPEDYIDFLTEKGYIKTAKRVALEQRYEESDIDTLSPKEIEIAYNIHPTGEMTFKELQEEIAKTQTKTRKSFDEVWAEFKESNGEASESLIELAQAGKLIPDKIPSFFKEAGYSAEEAATEINKFASEMKQLSSMKTGITSILDAYAEKRDSTTHQVGADTLSSMEDTLGIYDKENGWEGKDLKTWKEYKKIASSSTTSLKQLKKAQDDVATAYYNSNNFLSNLDETNQDYYKHLLDQMNVENSEEVIQEKLGEKYVENNKKKLDNIISEYNFADAEGFSNQALNDKIAALGNTSTAMGNYIIKKAMANNTTLNTSGDVQNLYNIASAAGAAGEALQVLAALKSAMADYESLKPDTSIKNDYERSGKLAAAKGKGLKKVINLQNKLKKITSQPVKTKIKTGNVQNPTGGGGGGGGGGRGSGTDKSQKKTKEYIDWIERRITRINNIIGNIQAKIENIGKWTIGKKMKLSDSTDNKTLKEINKELDKEIKYYKNLYDVQKMAEGKYAAKAGQSGGGKGFKNLGKTGKGKWTGVAKKIKKAFKKEKTFTPSKIIKMISNGDYKKKDFKKWYQGLSSDKKALIDSYIEFFDKAKDASKGMKEAQANARQAQEQKYEKAQELYDTRIGRAEAKEAMAVGYERQNKFVKIQIDNMKKSYAQQIEIAKLEGNFAEAERLRYEAMQKEKELLVHELDNLAETYNLRRGINNRRIQDVDNLINVAKARGTRTTLSWYNDKNLNEERNIASYQDEILKYEALADKNFVQYGKDSPEYQNALEHIQELENNIAQSNQNIAENTSALHDAWNQAYDDMRANNKRSADNLNTVIGFDRGESIDTIHRGADSYYRFTQSGLAKFGGANASYTAASNSAALSLEQYNLMKKANDEYQKATTEEEKQKILQDASVNSYEDLVKREQGYYDKYLSDRKDMYDAEQKIIDLMTDYYESQKTYLSELIDAKKKILDEEKDLYDYERNINEKTKNISDIQKQLAAIRGDNSEEGKARQQRLQNQLDEAQKALDDEEYNRWKTDQESMLDNLQTQFDDIIDKHLKEQNKLLNEGNELISQQGDAIQKAVGNIFTENSIPLSSDLTDIKDALGTKGLGEVFSNLNSNISAWLKTNGLGSTPTNSDGKDSENDIETYGSYDAKYKDSDTILKTKNKNANKKADKLRQYHDMDEMYKSDIRLTQSQIDKIEKKKKKTAKDKKDLAAYKKNLADLKKGKKNNLAEWNAYQKTIRDDASKEYDEAGTLEGMLFSVISNDSINSNTTKKSATSALNRVLLGTYGYSVSEEALKALAEIFGFEADGSYSESGAAYQFFKTHKMAGFKTGGIGRLVKASGEDGIAMVRNGEGFVMPEHVPAMQNLLDITPQLDNIVNSVNKNGSGNINNFGGFTFELPNVTDARSLINEFQNSKDMQKLLKISVEDLVGKGTYSNRIHSV